MLPTRTVLQTGDLLNRFRSRLSVEVCDLVRPSPRTETTGRCLRIARSKLESSSASLVLTARLTERRLHFLLGSLNDVSSTALVIYTYVYDIIDLVFLVLN